MSFSSRISPRELVIDDSTPLDVTLPPPGQSRGLRLGLRSTPFGAIPNAPPFPPELIIPRGEWQARIEEMEATKSRLSDIATQAGLPCKDQNGTNLCWINAPTYCVELMRVVQNQALMILSPASAGGPIKGFRNVGGWGEEGLSYIVENGLVPIDQWPANAIDRRYYTAENREIAKKYRVTEWWELVPRNLDQLISCLLRRLPVACGLNWWGHEVSYVDPLWRDGTIAIRHRNSWGMGWGDQGYGILQGNRMLPDDAVVPRVATAA